VSPISMAKNVWRLPTFSLVNVLQILNEGIEHDLILGGISQWILQLPSICMDTKHVNICNGYARACEGVTKSEPDSHISCSGSARECEGMNLHTPK